MNKRRSAHKNPLFHMRWPGISPGEVCATIAGSRRVLVENHRGIIEFSPGKVRLAAEKGEIAIEGRDLSVSQTNGASIIIEGVIYIVSLPEGGDARA